jgi:hypothetical protein
MIQGWIEGAFPEIHQNQPNHYYFHVDHIHIVWALLEKDGDYSTVINDDLGGRVFGSLGSRVQYDYV